MHFITLFKHVFLKIKILLSSDRFSILTSLGGSLHGSYLHSGNKCVLIRHQTWQCRYRNRLLNYFFFLLASSAG